MAITQEQYQMTDTEKTGGATGQAAYKARIKALGGGDSGATPAAPVAQNFGIDPGFSSSFQGMAQDIRALQDQAKSLFPTPPAPGSPEEAASPQFQALQTSKSSINTDYEATKEQIGDVTAQGNFDRNKALGLLGMSPATVKSNVEQFTLQTTAFDHQVGSALERLEKDHQAALVNADANYANQIQQQKINLYNVQSQSLQNSLSFMSNAWNMMVQSSELQQTAQQNAATMAQNKLNLLMPTYQGKDFSNLTPEEQANVDTQIGQISTGLGISEDATKRLLFAQPGVSKIMGRGDYIYRFDAAGNQVGSPIYAPTSAGGTSPGNAVVNWLNGSSPVTAADKTAVNNYKTELSQDAVLGKIMTVRSTIESLVGSTDKTKQTTQLGADLSIQNIPAIKKQATDSITMEILKSPSATSQITGRPTTNGSNPNDYSDVSKYVQSQVDELMPNSYLENLIVTGRNPFLDSGAGSVVDINTPTPDETMNMGSGG